MKHYATLFLLALVAAFLAAAPSAQAQTLLQQVDFETGEGYTADEFRNGTNDYLTRIENLGGGSYDPSINTTTYEYAGQNGSFFFAGEDIDDGASSPSEITLDPISIDGASQLQVSGLFASGTNEDIDSGDEINVQVSIDGGPFQTVGQFRNNGESFNTFFALDEDMDGIGEGPQLTGTFQDFTFDVGQTGSSLQVRVQLALNSGDEEAAFDNIRVTSGGEAARPTVQFASAGASAGEGDGSATFDVTLTDPDDSGPVTVDVTVDGASSTATQGDDFTYALQQVTFANASGGTETQTVSVDLADDDMAEGDEEAAFGLSVASGSATVGSPGSYTLTIEDDDQPDTPNVWLNEIHYDNSGADQGEFVEVVLPVGSDLSRIQVLHYNGSDGDADAAAPVVLSAFQEGATTEGFTFYTYNYTQNGESLENGNDAIAICYDADQDGAFETLASSGGVRQFLSYEGSFTATQGSGCAGGETATDIGVSESGGTSVGESLQLSGEGANYAAFTWEAPAADTPGEPNNGQTVSEALIPVEFAGAPVARVEGRSVTLSWATQTETNNLGFYVQHRGSSAGDWTTARERVAGAGNSAAEQRYTYTVAGLAPGDYVFRVEQVDTDGTRSYSQTVEAAVRAEGFTLEAPTRNPFQGQTTLSYTAPRGTEVEAVLYNSLGQQVRTLRPAGGRIRVDAGSLASGLYFVRLTSSDGQHADVASITLVR